MKSQAVNLQILEAVLFCNRWIPNGRSPLGRYVKRCFVLDLYKCIFGYYIDSTKTKLRVKYTFKEISTVSAAPLTNFFANDKALGFSVITTNRPFHLFAKNPEIRLSFLHAFASVKTIPFALSEAEFRSAQRKTIRRINSVSSTAETAAASCIDEVPLPTDSGRKFCLANKLRAKVRIIPYTNDKLKESFDSVASEEPMNNRARSCSSSVRERRSLNYTNANPFAITDTEFASTLKVSNIISGTNAENTRTENKELKVVRLSKKGIPPAIEVNINKEFAKNVTYAMDIPLSKEQHWASNSKVTEVVSKSYRRPKKITRGILKKKSNLTCIQSVFEDVW